MRLLPPSAIGSARHLARVFFVDVGLDEARINREGVATDKSVCDGAGDHPALTKPLVAGARERGMVWDRIFDREFAGPLVGQINRTSAQI